MQIEYDDNLWVAAGDGDVERTLRHLGSNHADLADEYGYTALMASCSYGHVSLAQELLRRGADPNKRDLDGNTSIHHCDFVECLDVLLQAGGDVLLKNSEGQTALEVKQAELEEGVVVETEEEEAQLDGELSLVVARLLERHAEREVELAGEAKRARGGPGQMELEEL